MLIEALVSIIRCSRAEEPRTTTWRLESGSADMRSSSRMARSWTGRLLGSGSQGGFSLVCSWLHWQQNGHCWSGRAAAAPLQHDEEQIQQMHAGASSCLQLLLLSLRPHPHPPTTPPRAGWRRDGGNSRAGDRGQAEMMRTGRVGSKEDPDLLPSVWFRLTCL